MTNSGSGSNTGGRSGVSGSFEQNAVTGGSIGVWLPETFVATCNNIWGNNTNWYESEDRTGIDGNISERPRYCDSASGDFAVGGNSPHLPDNNPCGLLIGALGENCGLVSVLPGSWGSIKGKYRE